MLLLANAMTPSPHTSCPHRDSQPQYNTITTIIQASNLDPKDKTRLLRVEEQRRLGLLAKRVLGKLGSTSVTKIEINGEECTTQKEMEETLLPVNEAKTRASEQTPFLQPEYREQFGDRNETETTDQVLQGTYIPPFEANPWANLLLSEASYPPDTIHWKAKTSPRRHITTDDHIRGWKRAKERTSAGMSGLHFGMFKAHAHRRPLAELDASMRSLAYTTGYSYNRWKKGMDVQLLKRSMDYRAEKLRTILLLEADFNMNNKALGADMMTAGERLGALACNNYGGRKKLQAAEISMNQQLTYNSIWGRRGRAVVMSNDAKGCYDRIAHTVLTICMRRLGVPRPAMQSMIETIQEMEHYIRTAFGDSEGKCGGNPV